MRGGWLELLWQNFVNIYKCLDAFFNTPVYQLTSWKAAQYAHYAQRPSDSIDKTCVSRYIFQFSELNIHIMACACFKVYRARCCRKLWCLFTATVSAVSPCYFAFLFSPPASYIFHCSLVEQFIKERLARQSFGKYVAGICCCERIWPLKGGQG